MGLLKKLDVVFLAIAQVHLGLLADGDLFLKAGICHGEGLVAFGQGGIELLEAFARAPESPVGGLKRRKDLQKKRFEGGAISLVAPFSRDDAIGDGLMVEADHVKNAEPRVQRSPAKVVGLLERGFVGLGKVVLRTL